MHGSITLLDTKSHDKILSIMTQAINKKKNPTLATFWAVPARLILTQKNIFFPMIQLTFSYIKQQA